jgi:hypothetical protein
VILDLLRGDELTACFFELDPYPEPNWLGHALMAMVQAIAPAYVAEKVLILAFVIGLPLSFRYCIRQFPAHDPLLVSLIFPFLMSYPLRMGFFNFCLGLPLMLLTVGRWRSILAGKIRAGFMATSVLLLLLYFSHLLVALVTIALLAGLTLLSNAPPLRGKPLRVLIFSSFPVIVLSTLFFVLHGDERQEPSRFALAQILEWTIDGRPFVSLSEDEIPYTRTMAVAMLAASVIALAVYRLGRSGGRGATLWWLASGAALMAAFALPDAMASGRFLTPRLLFFVMLFLCVALATTGTPRWLAVPLVAVVMAADLAALPAHHERTASLVRDVEEFVALSEQCPDHAVLLPLNYSDNWMHSNLACYLGAMKGPVVLDNYEAATPHMPIRWREGMAPYDRIGDFHSSTTPCVSLNAFQQYGPASVRLISTWRMPTNGSDSCAAKIQLALSTTATELLGQTGSARLFRSK